MSWWKTGSSPKRISGTSSLLTPPISSATRTPSSSTERELSTRYSDSKRVHLRAYESPSKTATRSEHTCERTSRREIQRLEVSTPASVRVAEKYSAELTP